MDKKATAEKLRQEVRKHNVSYNSLSNYSGVSCSTVYRIINNMVEKPTMDTLVAMQDGLKKWKKDNL